MKKLVFFENGITSGLNLTRKLNEKVSIVKSKNIRNSAKILLSKQKMKNLILIFNLVKVRINKINTLYQESRDLKKKNKYYALFIKIREVYSEIDETTKILGKKKMAILEIIKEKSNKKMFKLTNTCMSLFSNLFITRKPEIYDELYLFYLNQGQYIEVL